MWVFLLNLKTLSLLKLKPSLCPGILSVISVQYSSLVVTDVMSGGPCVWLIYLCLNQHTLSSPSAIYSFPVPHLEQCPVASWADLFQMHIVLFQKKRHPTTHHLNIWVVEDKTKGHLIFYHHYNYYTKLTPHHKKAQRQRFALAHVVSGVINPPEFLNSYLFILRTVQ